MPYSLKRILYKLGQEYLKNSANNNVAFENYMCSILYKKQPLSIKIVLSDPKKLESIIEQSGDRYILVNLTDHFTDYIHDLYLDIHDAKELIRQVESHFPYTLKDATKNTQLYLQEDIYHDYDTIKAA